MTVERGGRPAVSVVLPCFNEAGCVADCVTEALTAMRLADIDGEVVVVDNNSTDGSADLARSAGARVVHEEVPGYGSALRTGFLAADGEIIVMADADMTYDLSRIAELIDPVVRGEADLVNGLRFDGANRHTMPLLHRWVGTPVLTMLTARASGGRTLRDGQSGFRAFRRDVILGLDLVTNGMEFNSEMVVKSRRAGLRMVEIPMGYRERVGDSKLSTFSDGWRHLRLITSLAPDLLLVWPGLLLVALGVVLTGATLVRPSGFDLGALHWQPVFFSTICLVAGLQAVLAGLCLAASTPVSPKVSVRYGFVLAPRFQRASVTVGLSSLAAGLAVDGVLLLRWAGDDPVGERGPVLAAMAQSLILVGITFAAFGLIARLTSTATSRSRPAFLADGTSSHRSADPTLIQSVEAV